MCVTETRMIRRMSGMTREERRRRRVHTCRSGSDNEQKVRKKIEVVGSYLKKKMRTIGLIIDH